MTANSSPAVTVSTLRGEGHLNWVPDYAQGTPLDAAKSLGTCQDNVIGWLEEQGARSASPSQD